MSDSVPALPRPHPLALLAAGRRAFREVPGLRAFLLKGFLLLYSVSLGVGALGVGVLFLYVVQPLMASLDTWSAGEGFWAGLLASLVAGLLWFGQFLLMAATVSVSLLIAMTLLSVWFESLASRIIAHHRGSPAAVRPFRVIAWFGGLARALADSAWLLVLAVLSLFLGLIPVAGPLLVVLVQSYLLGREVRDPYLVVRAGMGEDARPLRRGLTLWTAAIGLVPLVLAMIPVLGWALLPLAVTYLAAGFAWSGEAARKEGR